MTVPTGRPPGRPRTPVLPTALKIVDECLAQPERYHSYDFDVDNATDEEIKNVPKYVRAAARQIDPELSVSIRTHLPTEDDPGYFEIRVQRKRTYQNRR